jgi:peroxiredoxin
LNEEFDMTVKRNLFSLAGMFVAATAAATLLTGAAELKPGKLGEPAPEFTLKDTTGKSHSLKDFNGKIVVMEWFNPECPVCQRVYRDGVIQRTLEELKKIDETAVYLAVNSTAMGMGGPRSEQDVIKTSDAFLKEVRVEIPVLIDHNGAVGRAFDARTTPHMFVIDSKGVLRFQGALDDDANGMKGKSGGQVTNYVVNAVRQIKAGETVSPDSVKSYGCGVKYAK